MKRILPWLYRVLFGLSIAFLVAGAVMLLRKEREGIMPMVSGAMLCLALASGGFARSRNWAFLIWLSSAIAIGMTFPAWEISNSRGFSFPSCN